MRNPVNCLATAAPRALDSLFAGTSNKSGSEKKEKKETTRSSRTTSFDLDLSSLGEVGTKNAVGESSSVVTFEELADLMLEDMVEGDEKWSV
jgi:hypothetical protein